MITRVQCFIGDLDFRWAKEKLSTRIYEQQNYLYNLHHSDMRFSEH